MKRAKVKVKRIATHLTEETSVSSVILIYLSSRLGSAPILSRTFSVASHLLTTLLQHIPPAHLLIIIDGLLLSFASSSIE